MLHSVLSKRFKFFLENFILNTQTCVLGVVTVNLADFFDKYKYILNQSQTKYLRQ